jgi:hypothetical protein
MSVRRLFPPLNTSRAGSLETAREIAPVYIRRLKKEEEKREREKKSRIPRACVRGNKEPCFAYRWNASANRATKRHAYATADIT